METEEQLVSGSVWCFVITCEFKMNKDKQMKVCNILFKLYLKIMLEFVNSEST